MTSVCFEPNQNIDVSVIDGMDYKINQMNNRKATESG